MKRLFCKFLMVLTLMPILACGDFPCKTLEQTISDQPCHQEQTDHTTGSEKTSGSSTAGFSEAYPMLFKDCSNLELHSYQPDQSLKKPIFQPLPVFLATNSPSIALLSPQPVVTRQRIYPDSDRASPALPAIYLSTLRIRI